MKTGQNWFGYERIWWLRERIGEVKIENEVLDERIYLVNHLNYHIIICNNKYLKPALFLITPIRKYSEPSVVAFLNIYTYYCWELVFLLQFL